MTNLGRCSALAPCLDVPEIACVDGFGNIQRECTLCPGCDPELVHPHVRGACPIGFVCAELAFAPEGGSVTGGGFCPGGEVGVPCAPLDSGSVGALVSNITMSVPSTRYRMRYFTLLQDPTNFSSAIRFDLETPPVNVTPPGPLIEASKFSKELHKLSLIFDKLTNRNNGVDACSSNLHPTFLASLGREPSCSWIDRRTYQIAIGSGATVDLETKVLLSPEASITFTSEFDGTVG